MNNDIDDLLALDLVSVPEDFTDRVMQKINQQPPPMAVKPAWIVQLQWLAIATTAAVGMLELFTFIFGIWAATTAY